MGVWLPSLMDDSEPPRAKNLVLFALACST
jgi:hypothetical protein